MNSIKIFEALGEVDDELIERAGNSCAPAKNKRAGVLKKTLLAAACVMLVVSLSVGGAMMMDEMPESPGTNNGWSGEESEKDWLNNGGWENGSSIKMFYSIEEFDAYRNGPENIEGTNSYFDNSLYVDFDSIIPNSEIEVVLLYHYDAYGIRYFSDENYSMSMDCYIDEDFVLSETEWNNKYIMDCRIEDLNDVRSGDNNYIFVVDGIEVLYQINKNSYGEISVSSIAFVIGNRVFAIYEPFFANTPSQREFINAFKTEAGTSAMLNRIKALIPGMDADETDEIQEEPDNSVSSYYGDGLIDQIANGSYINGYDNEDNEDYEFPVIPGISPDWKPNRNGKYPLKDGYTRYEISMILAGEIPLDLPEEGIKFGSETFPLIEEETEE